MKAIGLLILLLYSQLTAAIVNSSSSIKTRDIVRITWENQESICTGFFVNNNIIITAAHCFYHYKTGKLIRVASIDNSDGETNIKVEKVNIHPLYLKNKSSENDIAVLKVSNYPLFEGRFSSLNSSGDFDSYSIFGAGKVNLDNNLYGYRTGKCKGLKFGNSFYCFGASSNNSSLYGATVAPNDSGGPIVDSDGSVVAIGTRTTLTMTYGWPFPAISIGVLVNTKENQTFLKRVADI